MMSDNRLRSIVNEISGNVLADIGCDHGKVSISALQENRVKRVIACDISAPSLNKARVLAKKTELLSKMEFRCGDGLNVIKDNEVDIAVIAGMGGFEIMKILSNIPSGISKFILGAHTDIIQLREFLMNHHLKIDKDYVVQSGKHFYNILVVTNGEMQLSEKELLLGNDNFSNDAYKPYLEFLFEKYEKILKKDITKDSIEKYKKYCTIIKGQLDEGKNDN